MPLSCPELANSKPERGLRVQAAFGARKKNITFTSCRSCSFDILRAKLEKAFALPSSGSYAITFTDDDGEVSLVDTDHDIVEVLQYLHDGTDDSQSVESGFSRSSVGVLPSILLQLQIFVDYEDRLSEAGSMASFDGDIEGYAAARLLDCLSLEGPSTRAPLRRYFSGEIELDKRQSAVIAVSQDTWFNDVRLALPRTHVSRAWLQDQRRLAREANVGRTPPPSDYQFSLHGRGSREGSRVRSSGSSSNSSFAPSHDDLDSLMSARRARATDRTPRLPQYARPRRSRSAVFTRDLDARLPAIPEALLDDGSTSASVTPNPMSITPEMRPIDDHRAHLSSIRSSAGSIRSIGTPYGETADHTIICDHCQQPTPGVRFQCATCPSSPAVYNLCVACEQSSHIVHDSMHIFLKLRRPAPATVTSEQSLVPSLYVATSTEFAIGGLTSHGQVLCDECGNFKPLRGEWYWCLQCGRDLCAVHEAVDAHDDTHVFVLFKSMVDTNAFRHFAQAQLGSPVIPRRRALALVSQGVP